jgi:uncharacterized protein (TIGR03435 family)
VTRFIALAAILLLSTIRAQDSRQFEFAVIRPALPNAVGSSFLRFEGGRIKISNEPAKLLVRVAYELQNAQIAGGPPWLDTDRYDIEAKTGSPEKPTMRELTVLVQDLLADRFHLKFHREKRELTVYALVAGKGGPKLKASGDGETSGMNTHGGKGASQVVATATSMGLLASYVGNRLDRIVVDKTGLTGSYDFKLEWVPDELPDSTLPSLPTALSEQLGLKLETQKSPVEVMVIDSMEKPSEN